MYERRSIPLATVPRPPPADFASSVERVRFRGIPGFPGAGPSVAPLAPSFPAAFRPRGNSRNSRLRRARVRQERAGRGVPTARPGRRRVPGATRGARRYQCGIRPDVGAPEGSPPRRSRTLDVGPPRAGVRPCRGPIQAGVRPRRRLRQLSSATSRTAVRAPPADLADGSPSASGRPRGRPSRSLAPRRAPHSVRRGPTAPRRPADAPPEALFRPSPQAARRDTRWARLATGHQI